MLKIRPPAEMPNPPGCRPYTSVEFIEKNFQEEKEEKILKPPKKSKVSSKLSKTLEKSISQEIDLRETKNTSLGSDDNCETHTMKIVTLNLIVNNLVKSSSLIVNSSITIETLIAKALENFNALFEKEKTVFKLKQDPTLYGLKQTRKNGYPKVDMPNFHGKAVLGNTKLNQFSLIWNEDPSNYKEYFISNLIKEQRGTCRDCTIF